MRNFFFFILLNVLAAATNQLKAQESTAVQEPLDWMRFRKQVLDFQPVARQANLYRDQAAAALLQAKGGFDPKAFADYSSKNFNGKTYFSYTETGLKWPTWLGLELKGSYNLASGDFLNTENKLPRDGQAVFGFNWTLGQGLFIDERRAGLQQARIGLLQGEAGRQSLLNDLMLDAAKSYWNWVLAANQLRIFENALTQALIRHEALRESFLQGDKPAIDTVETFIQVQNRMLDLNFARVDLQNAALAMGNFYWNADNTPVLPGALPPAPELSEAATATVASDALEQLCRTALQQHPELRLYEAKMQTLDVERRLKIEKRKPVFDLNYNLLGSGWNFFPTASSNGAGVLAQDVKWGLNFNVPIFNRKARGDLQVTQVKIAQTALALRQKKQEVENKVRQYANDLTNLGSQMALYRDITMRYKNLLDGETERFSYGESSVFLLNTREQRWLDAQIKYFKLLSEYRKAEAGLQWAAGQLAE